MNIYIPTKNQPDFLKKLKEIKIIDDYKLDRSRFGKEKIMIDSRLKKQEKMELLIPYLPTDSIMVYDTEFPGKEFILCVGNVNYDDFSNLLRENIKLSIITKKVDHIRFNVWLPLSDVYDFKQKSYIKNLTSINGKIEKRSYFIIECQENQIENVKEKISMYSTDMIIKGENIFVNLLLKDFSELFEMIREAYERIEIIDQDEFFN